MIIDKSHNNGIWCKNSTILDDISYNLYLKDCYKYECYNITFQPHFINQQNIKWVNEYYDKAKVILIGEKIKKILKNGNR